jgi:hypothetical protein
MSYVSLTELCSTLLIVCECVVRWVTLWQGANTVLPQNAAIVFSPPLCPVAQKFQYIRFEFKNNVYTGTWTGFDAMQVRMIRAQMCSADQQRRSAGRRRAPSPAAPQPLSSCRVAHLTLCAVLCYAMLCCSVFFPGVMCCGVVCFSFLLFCFVLICFLCVLFCVLLSGVWLPVPSSGDRV